MTYTVDGVPMEALFECCWNPACKNTIPKERQGMYQYYCSDKCEKEDTERWRKIIEKAGL